MTPLPLRVLATISFVLPAACAPAAEPAASPSPTASSTFDHRTDVELVKAALRVTRAKKTAAFVAESVTGITGMTLTQRRVGKYDTARSLSAITQKFEADPPDAYEQISGDDGVDPTDLSVRHVLTADAGYLQMPGWEPPANTRWLRFTSADLAKVQGVGVDLGTAVFPPAVDMLRHASTSGQEGRGRIASPPILHVVVPAGIALRTLPESSLTRLVDAGVDFDKVSGEVDVDVEVEDGVLSAVRFDVLDAFGAALAQIGKGQDARGLTELSTTITLTDVGDPVTIVVPKPSEVMTDREFEAIAKR